MLKNRVLIAVVSFCFCSLISKAQVTMNLMPPPPIGVTIKNVLNPIIINGQKNSYNVYIIGTVTDITGKELAEYRTNVFAIGRGATNVNYTNIGLVYQNYMDADFESSYERTKYFPIGNFTLCATLIQDEGKVLAQACVPTHVLPLHPPILVYPFDSAKIKTQDPIFSWLPVTGPGASQSSIRYELTVTEILQGQYAAEAISSNPGSLVVDNVSNTFYPYPSTSLNTLNYGSDYVWQVKAYSGDYYIGQSDIWVFKLVKDSIKNPVDADSSYSIPKPFIDGAVHYAIRTLKFKYSGEYCSKSLDFKIYDDNYREIKIKRVKLWQNYGNNVYAIDLSGIKGMHPEHYYLLVVTNEKGSKSYLRFQYLNNIN